MKRKNSSLNLLGIIIFVAVGAYFIYLTVGQPSQDRPNILFIMTDQQSAHMMSCTGNKWLQTPSLDRLAASVIRFERAYASNPVCVPCLLARVQVSKVFLRQLQDACPT